MNSPQSPERGIVLPEAARESLVTELAALVEQHLAAKRGISGMAMKLAFNTLRSAKPDIAHRAARTLLPEVLTALGPLRAEFERSRRSSFAQFLGERRQQACEVLLCQIDTRLAQSQNAPAKAIYQRFRGSASDELETLLPQLAAALERHVK